MFVVNMPIISQLINSDTLKIVKNSDNDDVDDKKQKYMHAV